MPEGLDGIDPQRSSSWHQACRQSQSAQEHRTEHERQWIHFLGRQARSNGRRKIALIGRKSSCNKGSRAAHCTPYQRQAPRLAYD